MKKYFVSSDIHGFYDEWQKALAENGFDINNPEHIVIVCGDLFDRGLQAKECLDFIYDLLTKDRAICILGNHETMALEAIERRYFMRHDLSNGLIRTVENICTLASDEDMLIELSNNVKWSTYINSLHLFYETNKYIFVHGWIPTKFNQKKYINTYDPNWRKRKPVYWTEDDGATWLNGMKMWGEGIIEPNKTIVCGHWHTFYGHIKYHPEETKKLLKDLFPEYADDVFYLEYLFTEDQKKGIYKPFIDKGIIALDACTALSKMVNCIVLNEDEL